MVDVQNLFKPSVVNEDFIFLMKGRVGHGAQSLRCLAVGALFLSGAREGVQRYNRGHLLMFDFGS